MKWLMLLQLLIHQRKLQGLMAEDLILLVEGYRRPKPGPAERQYGGPSVSVAA